MAKPRALTSMRVESTRNGMSSVTISSTVWVDCQPCSSKSGLYTRTLAVPGVR